MDSSPNSETRNIPFEDVYKTHILDSSGKIERIHVFCASTLDETMLSNIFSELQKAYYKKQNTEIVFSPLLIHKDDTIRTIKRKILQEIHDYYKEKGVSFLSSCEEIYLYSSEKIVFSAAQLFQEITLGKRNTITKEEYFHYASLLNLRPFLEEHDGPSVILDKDVYTWTDWNTLCKTSNNEVFVPIGMNFQERHDYLFPTNPYHTQMSTIPIRYQFQPKNVLFSLEKSLLLNYVTDETNIMVCFAKNVFQYAIDNDISQNYMCKLYFPQLNQMEIQDLDGLLLHSDELHEKSENEYTKWLRHRNEIVDIFHEIYWYRKSSSTQSVDLPYIEKGVKEIMFTMYPGEDSPLFPLEYLFKHIHSTELLPFIKYNPGNRRENMYRLFSKEMSKTGKKIPMLEENVIFRLKREMKKGHHLSVFIDMEDPVFVYIDTHGKTLIHCVLKGAREISILETQLKNSLNELFENISNILQPLGYVAPSFLGFHDSRIHNMNIQYAFSLPLEYKIILKSKYFLSSVFDVIDTDITKTAKIRFKRVENYKEMDTKASMIVEIIGRGGSNSQIIDMLVENFGMNEESAILEFGEFRSQYQLFKERVLENPGFPIYFTMKSLKNELNVSVQDITSVAYLEPIFIYLDSFLRLSQAPKTIGLSQKRITFFEKKFKGVQDEEEDEVDNVITAVGLEPSSKVFVAQPIRFGEESVQEDEVNVQGIVFDDDDYYQDYEEDGEKDENEEDDSEEDYSEEYGGGGDEEIDLEERKKELDGTSIKNPTPFFKKMMELDPVLFVTEETSKFPLYSKACPSGDRRQPVILTDAEKKKIDETNPGSYGHALHHGSDPNNKYWYVCPQYWCLLSNSSISEEDVKAGKCGSVIPRGEDTIPKGAYVYEFNYPKVHMKEGKYIQHVPGFLKKDKHPDSSCIPCCFGKKWDSKDQIKRRQTCGYEDAIVDANEIGNKQTSKVLSYIIGPVTYPLPPNRWGFMPVSAQLFFNEDSGKRIDPQNPSVLLPNTPCLLRYGTAQSEKRSFLGVVAYYYAYKQGIKEVPTIEKMAQLLATIVDMDMFVRVQNGNLPGIFRPKNIDLGAIDIDKYSDTKFFGQIDVNDDTQLEYLEDTIASYENFLNYLQDENAEIDHTFLWDIVCMENPELLRDGMNLVILKVTENDITEKIQYICPSNAYSGVKYDPRKETMILLLQDQYYEPIHLYESIEKIVGSKTNNVVYTLKRDESIVKNNVVDADREIVYKIKSGETQMNELVIKKAFLTHNALDHIKQMLLMIQQTSKTQCQPLPSMPRKYNFKTAIPAQELLRFLKTYHYTVETQVVNYRHKTIAFLVNREDTQSKIYVPCYPSSSIEQLEIKYMDDPELWLDYRNTRDRLQGIYNESNGKIPCQVKVKIVEDNLVVGFLTETNQFVQINPPSQVIDADGIPEVRHSSYAMKDKTNADKILTTDKEGDIERETTILKIELETDFYNVFRSLARLLLNDYDNSHIRDEITTIIGEKRQTYKTQLQETEKRLRVIMEPYVSFQEIEEKDLKTIQSIMVCKGKETCDRSSTTGNSWKTCLQTSKGVCQNIFPKTHLLGKRDNDRVYYGRLADELLRYERIRVFMLEPKKYLNIGPSHYQINDDELFLLESLLQKDYFYDLDPYNRTKYIENIEYDNAQPSITRKYDNKITLKEQDKDRDVGTILKEDTAVSSYILDCILQTKPRVIGNDKVGSWKPMFPIDAKEIVFEKSKLCTFIPLIYILQDIHTSATVSIQNIKTSLWNGYTQLLEMADMQDKIITILRKQGKKEIMAMVKTRKTTLEQAIFSEDYYLTDLDYWVFCSFNKLPVILFSSTTLKFLSSRINWLRLGDANRGGEKYYFIRSPVDVKTNQSASYHMIVPPIALDDLKNPMFIEAQRESSEYESNWQTIENYLQKYHLIKGRGV
jgi:hypothetical protein